MAGFDRAQVRSIFQQEAGELLQTLSDGLLRLEDAAGEPAVVQALFRAAHTLKGSAAMMELTAIAQVAHRMEDLLGAVQSEAVAVSGGLVTLLLEGVDCIQHALAGDETGVEPYQAGLAAFTAETPVAGAVAPAVGRRPVPPPEARGTGEPLQTIRVDTAKLNGLINGVGELIISKNILQEAMVSLERIQRELEQLAFLFGSGTVHLEREMARQAATLGGGAGEALRQVHHKVEEEILPVRGELDRLAGNLAAAINTVTGQGDVLAKHTLELKNLVTQVRMIPVTAVFDRVPRIIRDAATAEAKEVRLVRTGEQTEIDRGVAEKVVDSLLHIIRNAVSHGIESPEERRRAGKNEVGEIRLSARTECGRVVVEVADDGGGIDLAQIREKALTTGVVSAAEAARYREHDWLQLIFRPSFSTARKVSAVSGRGVGMDVVKNAMEALKGQVEVHTERGRGTTITLSLPSSLDIAQAMRVRAGGQELIFLMDSLEMAKGGRSAEVVLAREGRFLTLGERTVPLCRLDGLLHLPQQWSSGWLDRPILVLRVLDRAAAILVDEIVDHEEIFVKPPHPLVQTLPLYAGATLLGDGRVRPILSAGHLLDRVAGRGPTGKSRLTPITPVDEVVARLAGESLLVAGCASLLPPGWLAHLAEHRISVVTVAEGEALATVVRAGAGAVVLARPQVAQEITEGVAGVTVCVVADKGEFPPAGISHWITPPVDFAVLDECLLDLLSGRA